MVADVVVTVVVTSAVALKNLDGLQYVGNHVVSLVIGGVRHDIADLCRFLLKNL
ncbi:hypothetical protein JOL79_27165 [Microbispora sp. RL4-1S]|uniref:Uncharacterized protein n=1 Tax=Microbispora oryzae TaxID=2806554 RepID=A0A940WM54_9ACTN|nr:hypothetical protein [Microbispora oryzae]MBP2707468.1 hypothetical protein [Microbispora oryzae]